MVSPFFMQTVFSRLGFTASILSTFGSSNRHPLARPVSAQLTPDRWPSKNCYNSTVHPLNSQRCVLVVQASKQQRATAAVSFVLLSGET